MRVLFDTCVISEVTRPQGSPKVRERVHSFGNEDSFISAITLGELAKGIALLEPGRKKSLLEQFLLDLEQEFQERILAVDADIARIWGETTARARKRGKTIPATDGLIAATAIHHGLHVMTRNTSDFEASGALLINPWTDGA